MKITADMCAYINKTPLTVEVCFRRQSNPKKKKDLKNIDLSTMEIDMETGELLNRDENINRGIRKARKNVVSLALCNPFEYFGTITISSQKWDISRPDEIKKALLSLLHTYYVSHPTLRYIITPEYGEKNGRLHFHFLMSGISDEVFINEYNYLDCHLFRDNFGHCQITRIGDTEQDRLYTSLYCSKYITKGTARISHRYFYASNNLKKPTREFLRGAMAIAAFDELKKQPIEEIKEFSTTRYTRCFSCRLSVWERIRPTLARMRKRILKLFQRAIFHGGEAWGNCRHDIKMTPVEMPMVSPFDRIIEQIPLLL